MPQFTKITGTLDIQGPVGVVTYKFEGRKVPNELKELPAYVGQLVGEVLNGASDGEIDDLRKQNSELQAKVDKLVDQVKKTKQTPVTRGRG